MSTLPGYSSSDLAEPVPRGVLSEEDKMNLALNTWRKTGSIAKVMRALGLKTEPPARVWLNRAIEAYQGEVEDERRAVFRFMADNYLGVLSTLFGEFEAGDRSKINELKSIGDRVAKLYGVDAVREIEGNGTIIQLIDSRLPHERGEVVEGEEVRKELEVPEPSEDL